MGKEVLLDPYVKLDLVTYDHLRRVSEGSYRGYVKRTTWNGTEILYRDCDVLRALNSEIEDLKKQIDADKATVTEGRIAIRERDRNARAIYEMTKRNVVVRIWHAITKFKHLNF